MSSGVPGSTVRPAAVIASTAAAKALAPSPATTNSASSCSSSPPDSAPQDCGEAPGIERGEGRHHRAQTERVGGGGVVELQLDVVGVAVDGEDHELGDVGRRAGDVEGLRRHHLVVVALRGSGGRHEADRRQCCAVHRHGLRERHRRRQIDDGVVGVLAVAEVVARIQRVGGHRGVRRRGHTAGDRSGPEISPSASVVGPRIPPSTASPRPGRCRR